MTREMKGIDVLAVMGRIETAPLSDTERGQMAEAREVVAELIDAASWVDSVSGHASFVSDECCCGSRMDAHDMGSGHAPVDSGAYYGGQALDRLAAALQRIQGGG